MGPIAGLVPMIHVADVERAVGFYRLLGFEIGNRVPASGRMIWAWLYSPNAPDWKRGANLMVARADEPVDPHVQAILFYLYATDLKAMRDTLLARGVEAGEIKYPDYLPQGEFRISDPDGYVLMIAQSGPSTP